MRLRLICALATAALCAAQGATAQSARPCGERETIVERLESKYGEVRTGAGLTSSNGMVEVYASEETGTWTIVVTMPTGQSCLIAAGEYWEPGPAAVTRSGAPV